MNPHAKAAKGGDAQPVRGARRSRRRKFRMGAGAQNLAGQRTFLRPEGRAPRRGLRLVRSELARIRGRLEDLRDYLDLLEARERSKGRPTFTTEQVRRRLSLPSQ